MTATIGNTVQACVARLLKPLVRVLLRYGVPYGVFADIAKRVYVEAAMGEFAIPGRKPSISRASVITGLSRKEILRVRRLRSLSDEKVQDSYNRATRVVSGWARDEAFAGPGGLAAPLPFEGGRRSFTQLVRKYSGDVPARAILDELLRVGSVERLDDGRLRLRARAYVPSQGEEEKIGILGSEVADLIRTIDHNLQAPGDKSRLQLNVAYDNLPRETLEGFRKSASRNGLRLLQRFDKELAGMDRDTSSQTRGSGRMRAGVSIFYFEEEIPESERKGGK